MDVAYVALYFYNNWGIAKSYWPKPSFEIIKFKSLKDIISVMITWDLFWLALNKPLFEATYLF